MGYHEKKVSKGVLGEASKIQEEFEEFMEVHNRDCKVLELCELSDLVGAIDHYLRKHHPSIKIKDLEWMAVLTESAFREGGR